MSRYLDRLVNQRAAISTEMQGVLDRADAAERDLTADELADVQARSAEATRLDATIGELSAVEERNAAATELARRVGVRQTGATAVSVAEPDLYRRGGEHSFFGDLYRSQLLRDHAATERLSRYMATRSNGDPEAGQQASTTTSSAGLIPPNWLIGEYGAMPTAGRVAANVVRHAALADARPLTIQRQTARATVGAQPTENTTVAGSDPAFDTITVTPQTLAGQVTVSRQLLDGSTPAIDQIVYDDLLRSYGHQVEIDVLTKLEATTGAAAATVSHSGAQVWSSEMAAALIAFMGRAYERPGALFAGLDLFGAWLGLTDTTGRPLLAPLNPMNAGGTASLDGGTYMGVPIYPCPLMPGALKGLLCIPDNPILFESAMLQYRYEEPQGPQSLELGVWAYEGFTSSRFHGLDVTVITGSATFAAGAKAGNGK